VLLKVSDPRNKERAAQKSKLYRACCSLIRIGQRSVLLKVSDPRNKERVAQKSKLYGACCSLIRIGQFCSGGEFQLLCRQNN
jgi:hypothetical protein